MRQVQYFYIPDSRRRRLNQGPCSLQATWIRNSLLRALRESAKVKGVQRFDSLVYNNPSIARLASFVAALAAGGDPSAVKSIAAESMRSMAAKYSADFPAHCADSQSAIHCGGDVVLITGTTGALGSFLLSQVVSDPTIARVYAVNRRARDGQSLYERQRLALLNHGIDVSILESRKVRLIEADVAAADFDLPKDVYDEVSFLLHLVFSYRLRYYG